MRHVAPAEVLAQDFDVRHEVLEVTIAEPYLFAKLEGKHIPAVTNWAHRHALEPSLTVLKPQRGYASRQHFLHAGPQISTAAVTEILLGQEVDVLETGNGWCRVRTVQDSYLGWIPQEFVTLTAFQPTHTVTCLRAHAYTGPRIQAAPVAPLSWGSRIAVIQEANEEWFHATLPDGKDVFVRKNLLHTLADVIKTPVTENWQEFIGTPYRWGGCSAWGLDCSGFVQLLHRIAGIEIPRDADEQFTKGAPVPFDEARPGDVVAFKGHVGLYLGDDTIVHAGSASMFVKLDNLRQNNDLKDTFLGFVRYTS
jgi:cell wall-associated NlpC family hydrolase